jgi:serine/threonine protein kinase
MKYIKNKWRTYKGKHREPWLYRREDLLDENTSFSEIFDDFFKEKAETLIGKWINHNYMILSFIGRGTFSIVYVAYSLIKNDYVVIKMILPCYKTVGRYEVGIIEELNSKIDNFPYKTFTWSKHPDMICIEQPCLGVSMAEFVSTKLYKSQSIDTIITYFYDCISQLNNIHRAGIIHTDLKLDNILTSFEINYNYELKKWFSGLEVNNMIIETYLKERTHSYWKSSLKYAQRKFSNYFLEKLQEFKDGRNNNRLEELENVKEVDDFDTFLCENLEDVNLDNKIIDLGNQSHAFLIDFGNSLYLSTVEKDDVCYESYRPPENILHLKISLKTDIWSMGCLFFEMLTNRVLFDIEDVKQDSDNMINPRMSNDSITSGSSINSNESISSNDLIDKLRLKRIYTLCHTSSDIRKDNIKKELRKYSLFNINDSILELICELIADMLQINDEDRPSTSHLLNYKLFKPFIYENIDFAIESYI